ncbi:MAG: peptide chain release factor 2 [Armatimonadetes bacterium]|nr:peptide chain release factor 2 [Armatimonadota bacterium]
MVIEIQKEVDALKEQIDELGGIFELADRQDEIRRLEAQTAEAGFWDDQEKAQQVLKKIARLKQAVEPWLVLDKRIEDLQAFIELAAEEQDDSEELLKEINAELEIIRSQFSELELTTFLSGEHDASDAIMEINAGAGGTESCDWVEMLLRMYLRWAERKGYTSEIVDSVEGEVAGLKNVTVIISGLNAYGYLKAEKGVHRLVRISPFDANKRRHTSFASVDVIPKIDENIEVEINPDDIRIDTFRASSAGGQHVNKTDSAVRITHIPTGIVVTCQNERSQHQNREMAMNILKARLLDLERQETEKKLAQLRGELRSIEWGNQIRSYVFQPYQMVKDHRTGVETANINAVMDGEIDLFIRAGLRWLASSEN